MRLGSLDYLIIKVIDPPEVTFVLRSFCYLHPLNSTMVKLYHFVTHTEV